MSDPAHDHFDRYFAEKLWAMLPEHFREEDGLAQPPGVLRGFVEVLAQQAATLRRSADRLWDDQFIELCSEWAVPYLGELVGTRMVSVLNRRARRVDVAKTIYYRRRAGTPRILEELIADMTEWDGKLVEEFRRLGRMRHGLDPAPGPLAGALTGTPPGGWADLRSTHGAELAGGPFDEFHHTPAMRRPHGRDGRYGIARLGLHLYRLAAYRLDAVTPRPGLVPGVTFTIDPSGRDVPLFIRRDRTDDRRRAFDWEQWSSPREWELPSPMRCRVLAHAEFVLSEAVLVDLQPLLINPGGLSNAQANAAISALRRFGGGRFPDAARLWALAGTLAANQVAALRASAVWEQLLAFALVEDCGKRALLPASLKIVVGNTAAARERVVAGNLANWSLSLAGKPWLGRPEWVVDPERGRLLWLGPAATLPAPPVVHYHHGFSGPIGAGGQDRAAATGEAATHAIQSGAAIQTGNPAAPNFLPAAGIAQIADSATHTPVDDRGNITTLAFRAADRCRPYLRLTADWRLDTSANASSKLTLDGLWIGADPNPAGPPHRLVLLGNYEEVLLHHVTLDPGGLDAQGAKIPPVVLSVEGHVERLIIDHCIVGQISVIGSVEEIVIRDSIVDGRASAVPAISVPAARMTLRRVTVFGEIDVEELDASEALITGFTDVTNTQAGCFRFSAVLRLRDPANPATHSRVPHPYESHFLDSAAGLFTSTRFGDPGFAQLSEAAPETLRRGAENGSEIGAWSALRNPIKLDSLRAKIDEFAPFGVLPVYLLET